MSVTYVIYYIISDSQEKSVVQKIALMPWSILDSI